jgi:D-alanyl-D-alanine carboxypeptidase
MTAWTRRGLALGYALGLALTMADGAIAAEGWAPAKKLDVYFASLEERDLVHGSIAVSERGIVRYKRAIGFAKAERGTAQPADEGTRYRVGPVTKLFTAVLILQLAERAQITLDNKLAEFFPDEPDALAISYREMLAAGAGLDVDVRYRLLGRVAEKVYDRPYADIVKREIVNKLGLVRTYYAGTGVSTSLESEPYQWDGRTWARGADTDDVASLGGAGGMLSNATDLLTFMDAIVAGRIVTPHNAAAMRDGGLGVRSFEVAGIAGFGERGDVDSFTARVYHFPAKNLTLAWTSNGSRVAVDDVIEEVLRLVVEKRRKPRLPAPTITPAG